MTETSFQIARKVMASANYVRGQITKAEGEVAKWTRMAGSHRENLREGQAVGCEKMIVKAIEKLQERRKKFADMQFPDPNLTEIQSRCETCGAKVPAGHKYCDNDECMC
jgi:hypothetical protein